MTLWRVLESVHGSIGVLAAAVLLHPAIVMRRGKWLSRGMRWAVGFCAAFAVLAFGSGILIYESYRNVVKRPLFRADPVAGFLFETKEHLAVAVMTLAVGGAIAAFAAPRGADGLRKLAALAFAGASLLCLLVVGLGVWVAAVQGFPNP